MAESVQRKVLIADPNEEFTKSAKTDPKAAFLPPIVTTNGKETQLILADKEKRLLALVVSTFLKDTSCISVIKARGVYRPNLALYLIQEEGPDLLTPEEIKSYGITEVLKRPLTYSNLVDKISPNLALYSPPDKYFETPRSG